jgi:hypothetical protein
MAQGRSGRKYLVLAGLVYWFSEHKEAQQTSADIPARWGRMEFLRCFDLWGWSADWQFLRQAE